MFKGAVSRWHFFIRFSSSDSLSTKIVPSHHESRKSESRSKIWLCPIFNRFSYENRDLNGLTCTMIINCYNKIDCLIVFCDRLQSTYKSKAIENHMKNRMVWPYVAYLSRRFGNKILLDLFKTLIATCTSCRSVAPGTVDLRLW